MATAQIWVKKTNAIFQKSAVYSKKNVFQKSILFLKKKIRWIPRHCHSHCQSPFHVVARTDFARVVPRISVVLQAFCEISLELGIKDWDWQKIFFFWFTWRDVSLFQFSLMFGKENVVIKSESWWNLTSMFAFSHWNTCKQSKNAMVFDIGHQSSNDTIQLTRKYWRWGYEILFVLDCDDKEKHSVEAWQCTIKISMRFWQRLNFNSNHPILFPKPELPFQNFQKKTLDKWYEWFGISQLQCKKTHEQFHKRKGSAYFFPFSVNEWCCIHACQILHKVNFCSPLRTSRFFERHCWYIEKDTRYYAMMKEFLTKDDWRKVQKWSICRKKLTTMVWMLEGCNFNWKGHWKQWVFQTFSAKMHIDSFLQEKDGLLFSWEKCWMICTELTNCWPSRFWKSNVAVFIISCHWMKKVHVVVTVMIFGIKFDVKKERTDNFALIFLSETKIFPILLKRIRQVSGEVFKRLSAPTQLIKLLFCFRHVLHFWVYCLLQVLEVVCNIPSRRLPSIISYI